MSKIKLSILLLISFSVFSCSNNQINNSIQKYSLAYIGGEYDGLLLKNYLTGSLKSFGMYDQKSKFEIQSDITTVQIYLLQILITLQIEKK